MSTGYRMVQWTPHKRVYDVLIATSVLTYVALFVLISYLRHPGHHAISPPIIILRALGTCAYLMLHVILCIGPLARLDRRFLPLLFNRRHLGVATFCVALAHALLVLGFYHGFGVVSPPVSLLTSNTQYHSLAAFPFEILGVLALLLLFLLAATSHDFWLHNLSPRLWKGLHMLVYPAWALLVMHVALGALRSERSVVYTSLVVGGALTVATLHLVAGLREARRDRRGHPVAQWIDVASVDDIPDQRGLAVCLRGHERVAVFRYGDKVSALSNRCVHQGGPLGEGRIIDGCVTCPWHGYTYQPHTGQSPPPFTEKVPTYQVRVEGRRILLNPQPLPAGTPVEPAVISGSIHA